MIINIIIHSASKSKFVSNDHFACVLVRERREVCGESKRHYRYTQNVSREIESTTIAFND